MGCINKKVLAWLAAAALAVIVFAPSAFGRLLPLLVASACPLGMILMMRGAAGGGCHRSEQGATGGATSTSESPEVGIARLRGEVERLRATREPALPMSDTGDTARERNQDPRRTDAQEFRP